MVSARTRYPHSDRHRIEEDPIATHTAVSSTGGKPGEWTRRGGGRASNLIAEEIKREFFAELGPGDWIGTEAELVERFGVSRITIRDAIRTLEAQGVLRVVLGARGGLRVAEAATERVSDALAVQLHLEQVTWAEVSEAMLAIEPTTARLAAEKADDEDVRRLRELVTLAEGEGDADHEAFTASSLDFHLALAEVAGNRALTASVRALRLVEQRLFVPQTSSAVVHRVVAAHSAVVDALAARDPAAAVAAMTEHLSRVAHSRGQSER